MSYNYQQMPMQLNAQQPFQQFFNNAFRKFSDYEIEKNIRQTVEQDMLREYDIIIQECYILLNEIYKHPGNSLTRDSYSVALTYKGKDFTNNIDNLNIIETELSTVMLREVQIVKDTKTIVTNKRNNLHKIYLPLFLISSKIEPALVFDIYDNIKDNIYSFNLFTYTEYLLQRLNNIMLPYFKTSKSSFLIPPLYDTSGNSFTPSESKLLSA